MESKSGWTIETLKEYHGDKLAHLEKSLAELDKNIHKDFVAQKELYQTVQTAAKEAIQKAEISQSAYNVGHNDLSKKMEAQYKEMIPRAEADSRFANMEEKLNEERKIVAGLTTRLDVISGKGAGVKDFSYWIPWMINILMFLYLIYSMRPK